MSGNARTEARIDAVARRAGVSITTVSRVLSPSGHRVSAETRERVLQAARALNYAPSALAQALARGTSRIAGILVGDNDDPYFAGIIRGAEAVANRVGYLVIVCNTERRPEREVRYVRLLGSYAAEGLLFIGGGLEDASALAALRAEVARFRARGGVVVATTQHRLDVPRVSVDSAAAAALAARHLVELGHRRIGLIGGPPPVTVSQVRAAGFRAALAEAGVALDPALVVHGDFTRAGGEAAASQLFDLPPAVRPTAIFAANDLMAIGTLVAARRHGVDVPGDISVVGLGDIPLSDSLWPPPRLRHALRLRQRVPASGGASRSSRRRRTGSSAASSGDRRWRERGRPARRPLCGARRPGRSASARAPWGRRRRACGRRRGSPRPAGRPAAPVGLVELVDRVDPAQHPLGEAVQPGQRFSALRAVKGYLAAIGRETGARHSGKANRKTGVPTGQSRRG